MGSRWLAAPLTVFVASATLACGPSQPNEPATPAPRYEHWPNILDDFRFHWSSATDVELTTGVAVPIRAYIESWYVATWTNDPDNVYPGFLRATPESDDLNGDYLGELAWIRPLNGVPFGAGKAVEPHGFMPMHILSVEPTTNGQRVTVCEGQYGIYFDSNAEPGKLVSVAADKEDGTLRDPLATVIVNRIELTQHDPRIPSDARDVTTAQEGPAPAPDQDVFGRWFITGASSSVWGPIDAEPIADFFVTPEMRQECQAAMPDPPEEQIEMATGFKDKAPPHGDPIPGWPSSAG